MASFNNASNYRPVQYNPLVGAASNEIASIAPDPTPGIPFISNGVSSNPLFGTAVVAGGGTGNTTFTAYAPVCGGTSSTGPFVSADTGISNSGYVLTSTGGSSFPTWQASGGGGGGIVTIDGDSGSVTGSSVAIIAKQSSGGPGCGSSIEIDSISATTLALVVTDVNANTLFGQGTGNSLVVANGGSYNAGFGLSSLAALTSGSQNCSFGVSYATVGSLGSLQTGSSNSALGTDCLSAVVSGNFNIGLGDGVGNAYTGSESSNIVMNSSGVNGESNTLRIGNATGSSNKQLSAAFICGIDGVDTIAPGGSGLNVVTEYADQLGTAVLTAGTNITITPTANTITISANSGSSILNYTGVNHAASPYTVLSTDDYISADVTGGVISILLPNAPTTGRVFVVKDKVGLAATSNITVTTVGGAVNIDGATTFVINTAYESVQLMFNGSTYEVY